MRLLLDEMISPAVARELRDRDHEVDAIKRDRPELQSLPDAEIVRRMALERRATVTNDIADFAPIHERIVAAGEEQYGMIFTHDSTLPRDRAGIGVWVEALAGFLAAHTSVDALRNRVHHFGLIRATAPAAAPGRHSPDVAGRSSSPELRFLR